MEYSCMDCKEVAVQRVKEMIQKSMELRGSKIQEVKIESIEANVTDGIFSTAIAALAMW